MPATKTAQSKDDPGWPTSPAVNNFAIASNDPDTFTRHPFKFFGSLNEGGLLSTVAGHWILGANSIAGLHDTWMANIRAEGGNSGFANVPTMLPALIVNYTAILDGHVEFSYETYKQQRGD